MPIRRAVGDREGEAATLNNIGTAYATLGERAKAVGFYSQALPIECAVGDLTGEARTLSNVADCLQEIPPAAGWLQALGAEINESLRKGTQSLSAGQRRSYAEALERQYRIWAAFLIDQGRLAEVMQALALIKTDVAAATAAPLTRTDAEMRWTRGWEERLGHATDLAKKEGELQALPGRTFAQEAALKALSTREDAAVKELTLYLDAVAAEAKALDLAKNRVAHTPASDALDASLLTLPKGTTIVYALPKLPNDRDIHLLVARSNYRIARTVSTKGLDAKVASFRAALQSPDRDPRPLAKELYDVLVKPVESELDPNAPVLWSLSGALRGVPIAALWDGKRYIAERFVTGSVQPPPSSPT